MYVLDTLTGLPANGSAMGYTLEPGAIGSPQILRDGMEVIGPQTGARRKVKKRYSLLDPNPNGSDPPAGKRHPSAQGQEAIAGFAKLDSKPLPKLITRGILGGAIL